MPTLVITGSASTQATSPADEGLFERGQIVELNDARRNRGIYRRPNVARTRPRDPILLQDDERFVDRAVVAPVEDQDLGLTGDLPRQANAKPVGIGRGQGELPERQAEALLQIFRYENGVFGGQHERYTTAHLLLYRFHDGKRRMPRHRPGVAQAEIDVAMAVDIVEMRALGLAHKRRECARPLEHPVHGDAAQQRLAGALEQRFRLWAVVDEALLLALHQGFQPRLVDCRHSSVRVRNPESVTGPEVPQSSSLEFRISQKRLLLCGP